jgi:hypothetical protein
MALLLAAALSAPGQLATAKAQSLSLSLSHFPVTGTVEVSYTLLPWYSLPAIATVYAGDQRLRVHFAVRDRTHFRVDIETISPAIDSGTLTVVVRGKTITSYDTRTETAGSGTRPGMLSPIERRSFKRYLLSFLMTGRAPIGIGPDLDPSQSVNDFVASLQNQLSARYPPEYPKSYARIVGQETLLGHPVDVVEFDPLEESDTVTGCSFSHPGHCVHHYSSAGAERLWIDHDHLFVLQARQEGLHDPHHLGLPATDTNYRVTDIAYGTGPSDADLQVRLPVKVVRTKNWSILSGEERGSSGALPPLPKGFVVFPQPEVVTKLVVLEGVEQLKRGPLPRFTAVNILYSSGRHVTTYLHPGDRYGFGLYVKGPYLYIQERMQVHGLPAALQVGTARTAGSCRVWTGTYPHQQHWMALAKGRISIQIVSNVVSEDGLVAYAARTVCS